MKGNYVDYGIRNENPARSLIEGKRDEDKEMNKIGPRWRVKV
jgi:hypothetical protein